VKAEAKTALQEAAEGVRAGAFVPSVVLGCEADGQMRFSTTLVGLGQFGRIPGDLARWHRRLPRLRRLAAAAVGIERLTRMEYGGAFAARSVACAMRRECMERVEARVGGVREEMPLLAGAVMHVPIPGVPFRPSRRPGIPAFTAWLIPGSAVTRAGLLSPERMASDALRLDAEGSDTLTIRLTSGGRSRFFLDEDLMDFGTELRIRVAGVVRLVPGREREQENRGQRPENSDQESEDRGQKGQTEAAWFRRQEDSGEFAGSDIHRKTNDKISLQESEAFDGASYLHHRD
jgi:hypothetical protein